MDLQKYFKDNYLSDLEIYKNELKHNCLCARVHSVFWNKNEYKYLNNSKNFMLLQYEFNLLFQILYNLKLNDIYNIFSNHFKYVDIRCTHENSPWAAIRWTIKYSDITIKQKDILNADLFLKNNMIKILQNNLYNQDCIDNLFKEINKLIQENESLKRTLDDIRKLG